MGLDGRGEVGTVESTRQASLAGSGLLLAAPTPVSSMAVFDDKTYQDEYPSLTDEEFAAHYRCKPRASGNLEVDRSAGSAP